MTNKNWDDWIGRSETTTDVVSDALLARYAATMNSDPADVSLAALWGMFAPATATENLAFDGHPPKGGFLPPIALPRRMWAGSKLKFKRLLKAVDVVTRNSTILSITPKAGGSGPLVFVKIRHVLSANGLNCIQDDQTIVYRGEAAVQAQLPLPEGFEPKTGMMVKSICPSETLLFRYSALTFNTHRIHYDRTYAQGNEGYPDLVVHGPLMASLMLDFLAAEFGRDRITEFTFQAKSPAYVGQYIHLAIGERAADSDAAPRGWTIFGADGRQIMAGSVMMDKARS